MRSDGWHLTEDVHEFLARTGDFLRSRPALHTLPLTVTETLRTRGPQAIGAEAPLFGGLERGGEVRAVFFHTPPRRLNLTPLAPLAPLTPLTPEDADALAVRLASLGRAFPAVSADNDTATAFAEAWQRHTGTTPTLSERQRLYRLGTLTPPQPVPEGRSRVAGESEQDREQLTRWYRDFAVAAGAAPTWADNRFTGRRVVFWETPDGTPVSMAATTPMVAGQVRVAPVYTPAHLRGRGYAGAATVEVSRAALAAGASEVVLFADLTNPTSNGLYQRIGYVPVADFAVYEFGH